MREYIELRFASEHAERVLGPEEFLRFLRSIYDRPSMKYRFPGIKP